MLTRVTYLASGHLCNHLRTGITFKIIFVVIIPRDMKFSACEHNGV